MVTAPSPSLLPSLILSKGWEEEEGMAREDGKGAGMVDLMWGWWHRDWDIGMRAPIGF